jgi:hypothetical protein
MPGAGLGHVYVVGRVDRIEHKQRTGRRGTYVAKYYRQSGVWDKPRPLTDLAFGWLEMSRAHGKGTNFTVRSPTDLSYED